MSELQIKHRTFALEVKALGDDGTFEGYLSVFGNLDSYDEIVAPGAFTDSLKSLETAASPLPVLWQHDSSAPIGVYTSLAQDATGLRVAGKLAIPDVQQAREAYALMKMGAVRGLSIGYYTRASSYDDVTGIRTLTQLDLVEGSVVTFPANSAAQVDTVKARLADGKLPTIREFEAFLRDAGGFSKSQAVAIATHGFKHGTGRDASAESASDLLSLLTNTKVI